MQDKILQDILKELNWNDLIMCRFALEHILYENDKLDYLKTRKSFREEYLKVYEKLGGCLYD